MKFPILKAKRVELIDLDETYLQDMYEYSVDQRLYQHLEHQPHKTFEETKEYFNTLLQRSSKENAHYWFIRLIDENKVIGSFGVHDINWEEKIGEISYGLSPHYWKKGYFNEALKVVLDYLFNTQDFNRVLAMTSVHNDPSIKGLARAGFIQEKELVDHYCSPNGKRYSAAVLGLTKDMYKNSGASNEKYIKIS